MVSAVTLALLWMLALGWMAVSRRPARGRTPRSRGASPSPSPSLVGAIGRVVRRTARRPSDRAADRRVGVLVVVVVTAVVVDVGVAVIAAITLAIIPIVAARRRRARRDLAVVRELPETIDLLRLALLSGGSLRFAIAAAAQAGHGPVADALGDACLAVSRGHRLDTALEARVAGPSPEAGTLVRALVRADRSGTRLDPVLDRLSAEARARRRRVAEAAARRAPVKLLVPLVVCILPAFLLLSLVPVLVVTFQNLDLSGP